MHKLLLLICLLFTALTVVAKPITDYITDEGLRESAEYDLSRNPGNRLLWQYRIIARAMQTGQYELATTLLDEAFSLQSQVVSQKNYSDRWWGKDRSKAYLGDPHERSLLYFYRGVLYWRKGDVDNARACFRASLVQDMEVLTGESGDWITTEYLDGMLALRQGDAGYAADSYMRTKKHWDVYRSSSTNTLPPPQVSTNVHIFFTGGSSVTKVAQGRHDEEIEYKRRNRSKAKYGAGILVNKKLHVAPYQDDLLSQALLNSRLMNEVLRKQGRDKDQWEDASENLMDGVALSESLPELQIGLATLSAFARLKSGFTHAEADTRYWDNAPSQVGYLPFSLPPGTHTIEVGMLRSSTRFSQSFTTTIKVPEQGDIVIYLSDRMTL